MRIESLDDKQALIAYTEETKCSVLHFLTGNCCYYSVKNVSKKSVWSSP